ncbi:VRR-NUC domain-containing protein [Vibrio sp. SCSIO 43137]|uniref:VRR-NUC domain-containing protein n=1 Tax=Vibrio sp. SCSIO 43137 TaxID=3021011 RepID=UPI00230705D6|nr:VRR-NUC domain-containing protein [Vibrio sp. SCSIO 43137]WCE32403.1 VRR-NUC domain-containing protein [Vibrio sp. SCSIO 43137]
MAEQKLQLIADYYRSNFDRLVDHARHWYADLLTTEEADWIAKYSNLTTDAQCLLVRLLIRKGEWFRSDKLRYDEISDVSAAARELDQCGFIDINPAISEQQLAASLLTRPELIRLFVPNNKTLRKAELVEQLSSEPISPELDVNFEIFYLNNSRVIELLTLLFFANTRQDISQFVTEDLGLHQFENYQLSRERRFFNVREQVDSLLQIARLSNQHENITGRNKEGLTAILQSVPQLCVHSYIDRKRAQLINRLARDLERCGEEELALQWYSQVKLAPSRERRIRILHKQEKLDKAEQILKEMQQQPQDVSEQEMAERLALKIKRSRGEKTRRAVKPQYRENHLTLELQGKRVELAVKEEYEQQGWQVYFIENQLLNALFGLAFWDIIFAPVDDAFINAYQTAPLDLYTQEFSQKRKAELEKRLQQLREGDIECIERHYHQKQGTANNFVHWPLIDEELLKLALNSIKGELLADLFEVMLSDLKLYRSGMPDLIAFKQNRFLWIEVKGPGDKLQDSQWRWINEFNRLQVPFSVCYVNHEKKKVG